MAPKPAGIVTLTALTSVMIRYSTARPMAPRPSHWHPIDVESRSWVRAALSICVLPVWGEQPRVKNSWVREKGEHILLLYLSSYAKQPLCKTNSDNEHNTWPGCGNHVAGDCVAINKPAATLNWTSTVTHIHMYIYIYIHYIWIVISTK